jgi:hypothetical protein
MSEVKVNKISPRTGTATTIGDSGDTFTVPSGANLVVAGTLNPSGTITAGSIAGTAIANDGIDSAQLAAGGIDTEHLGNLQVTTAKVAADAIDGTKLADNAIDSEHYTDGSIDNEHLADDAVGVAELSATGTASSSTFLRGDNSWTAVSGFDVSSITGATALGATPADTDEFVLSDAGTLKRVDFSHIKSSNSPSFLAVPTGSHALMPRVTSSKILFNDVEFDTDNCFDTSTSLWTPTTAGKYFVFAKLKLSTGNDSSNFIIRFYKNTNSQIADANYGNTWYNSTSIHRIIDMDGSTDNIAVWCYHGAQNGSGSPLDWVPRECWFGAFKIIGA